METSLESEFLKMIEVVVKGQKSLALRSSVRLENCMGAFRPPHPNPLPPKRGERE